MDQPSVVDFCIETYDTTFSSRSFDKLRPDVFPFVLSVSQFWIGGNGERHTAK